MICGHSIFRVEETSMLSVAFPALVGRPSTSDAVDDDGAEPRPNRPGFGLAKLLSASAAGLVSRLQAGGTIARQRRELSLSPPHLSSAIHHPQVGGRWGDGWAENRYRSLFHSMDLTRDFYFSYTYDLTNTLQTNAGAGPPAAEPHSPPARRPSAHLHAQARGPPARAPPPAGARRHVTNTCGIRT